MNKVLSIDFDYFQIVTADIVGKYYPDGIDMSPELSSVCWAAKYVEYPKLRDITVNVEELAALKNLLHRQKCLSEAMISISHKDIYSFLVEQIGVSGENVLLYNIDMHHDMFNKNKALDCGNWISYLQRQCNALELKWVVNPISEDVYGLEEERFGHLLLHSIKEIDVTDFDCVFLCRSDAWLPPHLDAEFDKLAEEIIHLKMKTNHDFEQFGVKTNHNLGLNFDRMACVEQAMEEIQDALDVVLE